jgi:hypothetical protein
MEVQMKKALSSILCTAFAAVLFTLSINAAVPGDLPENQDTIARGTAVIDGVKDDAYTVASEITTNFPADNIAATDYAKFSGYMVYDADALYVWAHIADPTLSANAADWDGDSVELFFNYNLSDGVGTSETENEPYGDCIMQFRMCPVPTDDHTVITITSGHGYDDQITADVAANPNNYYCKPDADGKGYTIECKFPLPTAKKVLVKPDYSIGFAIQINDSQEGNLTTVAARTGTVHSQSGDLRDNAYQYTTVLGRATFTNDEYVVEVVEEAPAEVPATDAPAAVVEAPTVTATAPQTGDSTVLLAVLLVVSLGAVVVVTRRKFTA